MKPAKSPRPKTQTGPKYSPCKAIHDLGLGVGTVMIGLGTLALGVGAVVAAKQANEVLTRVSKIDQNITKLDDIISQLSKLQVNVDHINDKLPEKKAAEIIKKIDSIKSDLSPARQAFEIKNIPQIPVVFRRVGPGSRVAVYRFQFSPEKIDQIQKQLDLEKDPSKQKAIIEEAIKNHPGFELPIDLNPNLVCLALK
jgi:hypothetical protein